MRLGTRLLVFSSVFLVMLPWFGFHFIGKIEQSLLQGQEEAQSMVASAIATVLSGYSEIFDIDEHALYVYPIKHDINIDGYDEDWGDLNERSTSFSDDAFSLLLVSNETDVSQRYLYVYLEVKDDDIVYRNPRYVSPDSSDHVKIQYQDADNNRQRIVILAEGQGNISAYSVEQDWTTWVDGKHLSTIYGELRETKKGYAIEFRLPAVWLEPARRLSISILDVFSDKERYPDKEVSTRNLDTDTLNPLLYQSHEISSVLKNLAESDSRICVIDKYRRVRAVTGGQGLHASFCHAIDRVSANLVDKVLQAGYNGEAQVERIIENDETLIVAARPVFDDNEIIGAVLVSKNSRQILSSQRDTLNDVLLATLAMFLLVFFSLLFFSSWLAYRINRLKKQATSIIDESGRFIAGVNLTDREVRDEIGDLSRSFTSLLGRLNGYTRFLETVPRMLRHEILNPVNTISMSLQNLKKNNDSNDIITANHAIEQLQLIVSSLTEAANIEEALTQEEIEELDIAALLDEYVRNLQIRHEGVQLQYYGVTEGVFVRGNDLRLVQLFDKVKDNAIDFAYPDTEISFHLDLDQVQDAVISIKNEGESILQSQLDLLFQGMISQRPADTGSPHLGIGLYVAQQIAQFHHGQLQITNRGDKQGVEVSLILPIVKRNIRRPL